MRPHFFDSTFPSILPSLLEPPVDGGSYLGADRWPRADSDTNANAVRWRNPNSSQRCRRERISELELRQGLISRSSV